MKNVLFSTVGELKKALQDIPDETPVEGYGPDCGGYDVEQGSNMALAVDDKNTVVVIAHDGTNDGKHVWSNKGKNDGIHKNIVGTVRGHRVFIGMLLGDTVQHVEDFIAIGGQVTLEL